MSHRRARHSLLLGCALAALAAPASAAPGTAPTAAPGTAPGDRPYRLDVPAGWTLVPGQPASWAADLPPPGPVPPGLPYTLQTQTWRGPQASLIVTWILADAPADADAVHRLWGHTFVWSHNSLKKWKDVTGPRGPRSNTWDMLVERYEWQHLTNRTTSMSHTLAFLTTDSRPAVVNVRCVIPSIDEAAVAGPRAICERTLRSLQVPPGRFKPLATRPPRDANTP
jgi:hypothetical protein